MRSTTRPRGYAEWAPRADTRALLAQVSDVLDEYRHLWPLTLRQVFYRLVAVHGYPKDERAYKRLGEHLNRARRAELIPWQAIRDDGSESATWTQSPPWREWLADLLDPAQAHLWTPDPWDGQPHRVEVWTEAAGMVPMLSQAVSPWRVPVHSGGGFASVTALRDAAVRIAVRQEPTVVLHVGDHDPSGVHIFASAAADVSAFVAAHGGSVDFRRVAVLPEHIDVYGLATAPAKAGDRRSFAGETVQCEALPPDVLAGLVGDAVRALIDPVPWAVTAEAVQADREALAARLAELGQA